MIYVMFDGLVLGELYLSETNKLRFKRDKGIDDNWLPMFLSFTVEVHDKDIDLYHIYAKWLEERVIPPNRMGLKRILKMFGMKKYDVMELAKKTNASLMTDPYWIAYKESDCFSKNSLRGLFGNDENPLGLVKENYRWKI